MSIGVWVPTEAQFGSVAAERARRGGVQRAVTLAIQRHIFDVVPEHLDTSDAPSPRFAEAIRKFADQWKQFAARQPETNTLLQVLVGTGDAPTASSARERTGTDASKTLFCVTLYGLCWCLALGRVPPDRQRDEEGDKDEGNRENGDDAAPDTVEEAQPGELSAEFSSARAEIAELVLRAAPKQVRAGGGAASPADHESEAAHGAEVQPRPTRDHARLVADALLHCLLSAMPDTFRLEDQRLEDNGGAPVTRQRIVVRARELRRRIERLLEDFPFRVTAQPLRQPVYHAYVDDYAEGNDARIHIPLIGYRRTNAFLDGFLEAALKGRGGNFNFKEYTRAVNAQQAVAWRINKFVLRQAECLAALVRDPAEWKSTVRLAVAEAGLEEGGRLQALQDWVHDEFYKPVAGERKLFNLPGEFLDSALARVALKALTGDSGDGGPQSFYLAWKGDYRGRIYAETPWLTPQGGDLQRALFEFAHGRPLDEVGERALRRHGANLVRRSRVLADLGINGRQVVTLDERERWVSDNEANILRSAEAPLAHPFWREVASKPMQFLAFCNAYRQWMMNPSAPLHLPVQIDGTCNGLQHIAALTGNVALARAVNVLPREDGLPADIYSELAEAAQGTIGDFAHIADSSVARLPKSLQKVLTEADAALAKQPDWRALLDRGAAKMVVMTVPYGASARSQANRILREVLEPALEKVRRKKEKTTLQAPPQIMQYAQAWGAMVQSDAKARKEMAIAGKGSFKFPPFANEETKASLRAARTWGAAVAWVMAWHVRAALKQRYPIAPGFEVWLKRVASQCEGLPLMWLTPLGLPVCQDHFREAKTTLNARLGGSTVSVGVTSLKEQVFEREQAQSLLPNLIHSLDATHLAMTINAAVSEGVADIGSIHDCLLCHPNEAQKLGQVVRKTFVDLYCLDEAGKPGVLDNWTRWMKLVARIAAFPIPNCIAGAVNVPGGIPEQMLERYRDKGKDATERAIGHEGLELLKEIRGIKEASEQSLACMLVEYAAAVTIKEPPDQQTGPEARDQPKRTRHAFPPKENRRKDRWRLEGAGGLPLTSSSLSDYFFS